MEIYEIRWESSEDKKPAWNRAKVSMGAAGRLLTAVPCPKQPCSEMHKSHENLQKWWKSMKINEIRWQSSEDKRPAWNRAKVCLGAAGRTLTVAPGPKHPCSKIHENQWKSVSSLKIHENHEIMKIRENLRKTKKVFRGQIASQESSKGLYNGSRSNLTVVPGKHPCSEVHDDPSKSRKLWQIMEVIKIHDNLWNTKKVLRGQEPSLESSKGFL